MGKSDIKIPSFETRTIDAKENIGIPVLAGPIFRRYKIEKETEGGNLKPYVVYLDETEVESATEELKKGACSRVNKILIAVTLSASLLCLLLIALRYFDCI